MKELGHHLVLLGLICLFVRLDCTVASPLRSAQDVLKKLGEYSSRVKAKTSSSTCFGYGSNQDGTWSEEGTWKPKNVNHCDFKKYWDFFEDKDTVTAVSKCMERRRWIVLVGDSNTRKMFTTILNRFKELNFKYEFLSGTNRNLHGDNRWSDRDAIFYDNSNGNHSLLFRLSFRFYRSYDTFKVHWRNWDTLYETDGSRNVMQEKEPFSSQLKVFHESFYTKSSPDTIILSTGLWKLSCENSSIAYDQLLKERNENGVTNVLFFTAGHLNHHPTIENDDIRKVRNCIFAERDRLVFGAGNTEKFLPIFDVFELTKNIPDKSWIGYGGGYHYVSDYEKPSPAAKAIIAAWNTFLCT